MLLLLLLLLLQTKMEKEIGDCEKITVFEQHPEGEIVARHCDASTDERPAGREELLTVCTAIQL